MAIRPVIAIDGTFLKGKYKGTMFVTLCMDGNNQIYLLAFGISDSEDDASWEAKLRDLISNVKDLVFISNPNGSIKKGVAMIFSNASLCMYHLDQNLRSNFKDIKNLHICCKVIHCFSI